MNNIDAITLIIYIGFVTGIMPKPLHLLSKRRRQQLINYEITRYQHLSPTLPKTK